MQVLALILLEKKVVVQSHDYSALTFCILAMTRLLYPLEYVFPVIPLLPSCMPGSEQVTTVNITPEAVPLSIKSANAETGVGVTSRP